MSSPFEFFNYKNKTLCAEDVPVSEIVKRTGTPVYIYSSNAFLTPLKALQKGLYSIPHLVCFAMKSNGNLSVLKLLSEAGAGMDLVSGGELYRAEVAGVQGNKIVFSGVGKTKNEMAYALRYRGTGILSFNVESVDELETLHSVAKELNLVAPVALRFNPDVDAKTHPYISTGLKKNKFGLNRDEIIEISNRAKQLPHIKIKGLSIHIGSQLTDLSPLSDAFAILKGVTSEVEQALGNPLEFLDLGGGLGITYKDEAPPSISDYCMLVQKHFGDHAKKNKNFKIVLEPGRTISGNAGILVTEVLYQKKRDQKNFLIVDASMTELIRPALYESYHGIVPVQEALLKANLESMDIVGPVCESSDCFASDRALSSDLENGDLLAILSAGAYGFTMASQYNARPKPSEVLVEGDHFRVIRNRETYSEVIRGESL